MLHAIESNNVIMEVKNLKVWFPVRTGLLSSILKGEKTFIKAVDDVSFRINMGDIFSLIGESGCGKSTLGKALVGLVDVTSGRIIYRGIELTSISGRSLLELRRELQIIMQDPYESLPPHMTVFDIVAEPLLVNKLVSSYDELENNVVKALEDVGLIPYQDFMDKFPHQLSGGQRQRVAIASVLTLKPRFIVADEPVSMLDVSVRAEILKLMLRLKEEFNLTYLFITHDISIAKYISNRSAIMYLGNILEMGDTEKVIEEPIHPYTKALISVVPEFNPKTLKKKIILRGEVPSPINKPQGCPLHPRCPLTQEICKVRMPELKELETRHYVACHLA
ncbi:MAG: ABC transporter ATP-binding protein [Candidatus Methanomethylicia archaeon]